MPHSTGWERRRDARSSEPAAIGDVVDGLLREEAFARGLVIGRLASIWSDVVGERLGARTTPTALDQGVLTVSASDPVWGAQARFLHDEIRRKVDERLGSGAVRDVRIVIGGEPRNRR